ncbi:MAG: MGMT family protein [Pseudomonadota bacterium]
MPVAADKAERILAVVVDIPAGAVASYGQVADVAGMPGRARLVGRALRELPSGSTVPWHRVITASGALAFPTDSPAWRRQRDLLADDGVVLERGKVPLARYRWAPSLDELLWKPPGLQG